MNDAFVEGAGTVAELAAAAESWSKVKESDNVLAAIRNLSLKVVNELEKMPITTQGKKRP